jgi:carbon storage regulator
MNGNGNLVLTRKKGESVIIGDNIEVTVVEIGGEGRVRLSFNAPSDISIHREEVYNEIMEEEEAEDA